MNDSETKARLEHEARRLFAQRGYRGASIRAITRAARTNLGAVTYHFGTKEALYQHVLESVFNRLAAHLETAADAPGSARERLAGLVHALFAFFETYPDAPRLLLRELATGDGIPPVAVPYLRRNLAAIRRVVSEGQTTGHLRPVDPTLVAFTLMSQSVWYALVGRSIPGVLGEPDPGAFAERIEAHVAEVVHRFATQEI